MTPTSTACIIFVLQAAAMDAHVTFWTPTSTFCSLMGISFVLSTTSQPSVDAHVYLENLMTNLNQIVPNPLGVIRAHDVGYGWVKSVLGYDYQGKPVTHAFPSVVCQQNDDFEEVIDHAKKNIKRVSVNNKTYIVGKDIRFMRGYGSDQIQHNEYVKTDEYLALLRGALSYDSVDHIDLLMLGLPHKYIKTHKQHLIDKAKGIHKLENGRTVYVKNVAIISQPLAAAYNHSKRAHARGADSSLLASRITLTIESGWFTLDWTISEGLKTYDQQCGSVEGGASIIGADMMREASKYTDGLRQLDDILKFDNEWRLGTLRFGKDDLSTVKDKIDKVRKQSAEKYFSQMRNMTLNFKGVERVVSTGGSIHLYEDLIENEFQGLEISTATKDERRWDVGEGLYWLGEFVLRNQAS